MDFETLHDTYLHKALCHHRLSKGETQKLLWNQDLWSNCNGLIFWQWQFLQFEGKVSSVDGGNPLIFGEEEEVAQYAYLGAPNVVKWGVPGKILQNVVQMLFLGQ